jgi:hypothetical protein
MCIDVISTQNYILVTELVYNAYTKLPLIYYQPENFKRPLTE